MKHAWAGMGIWGYEDPNPDAVQCQECGLRWVPDNRDEHYCIITCPHCKHAWIEGRRYNGN